MQPLVVLPEVTPLLIKKESKQEFLFFKFPKSKAEINDWCNLIKRRNGKDGFVVKENSTYICSKHFHVADIYRAPGGTRHSLIKGSRPKLHSWNTFGEGLGKSRKPPSYRTSPRKKMRLDLDVISNQEDNICDFSVQTGQEKVSQSCNENTVDSLNPNTSAVPTTFAFVPDDSEKEKERLKEELFNLKTKLQEMEQENEKLKNDNFCDYVLSSDKICNHYTGFPSVKILEAILNFLDPGKNGENMVLYNSQLANEDETRGRKRALSPMISFILTLARLRRNFGVKHLMYLFKTSEGTVINTILTWINYMYIKLGSLCIWPNASQVKRNMPNSMKEKFPNVKCIIDCVEFKIAVPSSLVLHKLMYSDYKSHTTVKALVGIAPGGGFTFISSVFPGSISDKDITVKSGLLNRQMWELGEELMADRGFTIEEYLSPLGVKLVIPSFLKGREQFTEEEVIKSQQIINKGIHVERMIQQLKCFHIFDGVIPLHMIGSLNQIITVCALLFNFQEPIIKYGCLNV